MEGLKEVGRRQRRRKELLDDLKETIGHWKWKEEVQFRTLCGQLALAEAILACRKADRRMNDE
jgi:hypothetical protein